ncbi:MAG: SDR family NAD(P)-dependent oxidoreductase [Candidatus Nitrosopolaris sp.]
MYFFYCTINPFTSKGGAFISRYFFILNSIELDVSSVTSVKAAITKILYEKKRIDLVVNNAGYALVGPFEDSSMDEIKAQVETNFFGPVRVVNGILLFCSDGCCKNNLNTQQVK